MTSDELPTDGAGVESSGIGPIAVPSEGETAPKATPSSLAPWAVACVLALLSGLLGFQLYGANGQVASLRKALEVANAGAAAQQPQASASQDPAVTAMLQKLPRRQEGDPLAKGRVDAPVVLTEWADYRCPFCAVWARDTLPALQPYIDSGSLRIEFRDLQIFGEESIAAARGARAAGEQGLFWEFYAAVFAVAPPSGHPTITDAEVMAFAKAAGVKDMTRFTKDYNDPKILAAIQADIAHAKSLGLNGTPFFVVNTTPVSGAQPAEAFISLIEKYGGKRG